MQLKYNRQQSVGSAIIKIMIKFFFVIIIGIVAIFLIEKIDFPSPEKKFKIDITNEVNKLK
tara:strand:- start:1412 stop:1594 length:183 start_codon:yes stop_codon:yes gene_type:complete